jgi:hypothetical protein
MNRKKPLIGSGLGSAAGEAGKELSHEAPGCVMGVRTARVCPVHRKRKNVGKILLLGTHGSTTVVPLARFGE